MFLTRQSVLFFLQDVLTTIVAGFYPVLDVGTMRVCSVYAMTVRYIHSLYTRRVYVTC